MLQSKPAQAPLPDHGGEYSAGDEPRTSSRWRWSLDRIRSMSGPEILFRMQEARKRALGRTLQGVSRYALGAGPLGSLPFDGSAFETIAKACEADWRQVFCAAQSGEWQFLGQDWPRVALDQLWHLDPVSGDRWAGDKYCFDIDFRHQTNLGDVKYVWEINRLQFLPPIAAYFRQSGSAAARTLVLDILQSWCRANPPFSGVNWCSGIELAIRATNILATVSLLGSENIPTDVQETLRTFLNAHLQWLDRFPSLFSSANNHLIAEQAAIYMLGNLMPDLANAAMLVASALETLETQSDQQFLADGVGAEQSVSYAALSSEWYLLCLAVTPSSGRERFLRSRRRLAQVASFTRHILDENAQTPRIGDDDDSCVILSGRTREKPYVAQILAGLCTSLTLPDLAPPAVTPHLRQLWLGQPLPGGHAAIGSRRFDTGGYTVLRHHHQDQQSLVVFDHGPLGHLSISAHGHADALAIWWHLNGQPVFVDAGTGTYHADPHLRNTFRGTVQHNTLSIEDQNQSRMTGPFNWSDKAMVTTGQHLFDDDNCVSVARHDGYLDRFGVWHERRLQYVMGEYYCIQDHLPGTPYAQQAKATVSWMLDPEIRVERTGSNHVILTRDGVKFAQLSTLLRTGNGEIGLAQKVLLDIVKKPYSPAFGVISETTALESTVTLGQLSAGHLETRFSAFPGNGG